MGRHLTDYGCGINDAVISRFYYYRSQEEAEMSDILPISSEDCKICQEDPRLCSSVHIDRMTTLPKNSEELRYFPRNMGKSFLQFQEFMVAVKAGESVAYLTPEGEVSSPKRAEQLITAQKQAVVDEIIGMLVELDKKKEIYDLDAGSNSGLVDVESVEAIPLSAISELRASLQEYRRGL